MVIKISYLIKENKRKLTYENTWTSRILEKAPLLRKLSQTERIAQTSLYCHLEQIVKISV